MPRSPNGPRRRWATISIVIIIVLTGMAAFAGIHRVTMPQARVETIDRSLCTSPANSSSRTSVSALEADGSVTVRVIGQQYSFTPSCILVPTDTPIHLRATSADVVHGIRSRTNVNTMLVPGYVSEQSMRFEKTGDRLMPCQEYCSVGHEGMWAKVKVIEKAEFTRSPPTRRRLSCVE